jgi:hypothetical protein
VLCHESPLRPLSPLARDNSRISVVLCHAPSSDFDRDDARVSVRSGWRIVDEFAGSRYRARRDASILLCFHDPLDLIERNLIVAPIAIQAKRGNLQLLGQEPVSGAMYRTKVLGMAGF